MNNSETVSIKDSFIEFPHCFTQQDILEYADFDGEITSLAIESITNDSNFTCIQSDPNGDIHYISNISLVKWYIRLNRRLVEAKSFEISEEKLHLLLCELRKEGRWSTPPKEYIEFGIRRSLLKRCLDNTYAFPLAYILSFLSPSNYRRATDFIAQYYTIPSDQEVENELASGINNILTTLTEREEFVICRREGLLGQKRMTLELIGNTLGVTRERIRQIENKCWRRITHPRRTRLLIYPFFTNQVLKWGRNFGDFAKTGGN